MFSPNDEIGICEVALTDIPEGREPQDMWLSVYSDKEKEQMKMKSEESSTRLRKRDRAIQTLLAPNTRRSTKRTALHVEVGWRRWTQDEEQLIQKAIEWGARHVLDSEHARNVDPALRQQLLSGTLLVTVQQCTGLRIAHGFLMRHYV